MRKLSIALFALLFGVSSGVFAAAHAGGKSDKADAAKKDDAMKGEKGKKAN